MIGRVEIHGTNFICSETKRVVQLRGVSLSGSCKLPVNLPSHAPDKAAFLDHRNVSYVGRPFPLEEMDEHLSRIRDWGFNLVRLVVTWEALEHSGWQKYDNEYIEYLRKIVEALPNYGLKCIIDAHQDVFSRLTGGSGAPGWVVELIGFSQQTIHATHAAHLHPFALLRSDPPSSVWPTGYQKLAASTCNTVFWAGDAFTPQLRASQQPEIGISSFLQEAMAAAYGKLADRLEGLPAVLGFEPMNEPHRGYLELHSLYAFDANTDLQLGYHATAIQSFAIGDGYAQRIPYYVQSFPQPTKVSHHELVNQEGHRAWLKDRQCIWRQHGVWEWDNVKNAPVVMRQTYFERNPETGKPFEWYTDAWYPFVRRFAHAVTKGREQRRHWMTFAAGIPNEFTPKWPKELQPPNLVSAPHFYDLHALFTKSLGNITFNVQGLSRGMFPLKAIYIGRGGLENNYELQIKNVVRRSRTATGRPSIIGEIGVPFDMNKFEAAKTGDWRWQERQMDALCAGLEKSMVSYVLWNYNPDNDNEHGDAWYGENFSIFSKSMLSNSGKGAGRCVDMFQRPYAIATPGIPIRAEYDPYTLAYVYQFRLPKEGSDTPASTNQEVEIYLPGRRYTQLIHDKKAIVQISDGKWTYLGKDQMLRWTIDQMKPGSLHTIHIHVPNEEFHKIKPPELDLSETAKNYLVMFLALLVPLFVYGVYMTFQHLDNRMKR